MSPRIRTLSLSVLRRLLGLINALMPKCDKAVLHGKPDNEDSIMELGRQLAARGDIITVILVEKIPNDSTLSNSVQWRKKRSVQGLFHYLTARYVFFTHGLYLSPTPPGSQICVNVWHGMPIKRVGHMLGREPPRSTKVVATSQMFAGLVADCFGKPVDEILVTGLPRNDVMVRAAAEPTAIRASLGLGNSPDRRRLIVWMPTYRQTSQRLMRTDGNVPKNIFGLDDLDVGVFSAFLQDSNTVCVIKPHPLANAFPDCVDDDWIRVWHDDDLSRRGVSLYELIGASDLLITDASSVYVDYLILKKPVIIAFPDLDEYRRTRGFALEPLEQYFAGPFVSSFLELKEAISDFLEADHWAFRRSSVSAAFHDSLDDCSTERLIQAVIKSSPSSKPH